MLAKLLSPLLLAACLLAYGQGADDLSPPRFTIETTSATRHGCVLQKLDDASTLIALHQEGQVLPPLPVRDFVLLSNGDRLPLDADAPATLQENRLLVWPAKSLPDAHEKGLRLYLPYVVLVFWTLPQGVDDADLFFAKLAAEPRKRDMIYLQNGDRIEGTITTLGPRAGCVITVGDRPVHTSWSKLAGIAWNTDRQAHLRARKTTYHAVWRGGARISFSQLSLDEKSQRWIGKTQFGPALELPTAQLLALSVRHGPAVDLSDLVPALYEQPPYLGVSWPLKKNVNVAGHPLRLGNNTYDQGLGLHAPCRVTYALGGQYQRFSSLVGLDASAAPRSRVRLAVELDGKRTELNAGQELTHAQPPLQVQLDVRGKRTLTLIAEVGSFGDVQAHVNWANARLIKKTSP